MIVSAFYKQNRFKSVQNRRLLSCLRQSLFLTEEYIRIAVLYTSEAKNKFLQSSNLDF